VTRWPLLILALAGLARAATILVAFPARGETMSVTESASYPMSDEESRNAGRQHCVEAAKHTALDRAGSVFEADLRNERSESGQDEAQLKMRSYFAGVVSSEMVGDRVDIDPEGRATETCTVRIGYDPATVSAKMQEIADAEGLRKQVAAQQTTIASLQDQMRQSQQPPAPQVTASPLPPNGFAPPPQVQTAQAAPPAPRPVAQVYYVPASAALVPVPPPAPAPRPVYYAPASAPAPRPVYYAPPSAPPPMIYYAPPPMPRPIAVAIRPPPRPRVARAIRRLLYWRP